jgi:hypothetical protein
MPEEIEGDPGLRIGERLLGGWRMVASAWLIAMVLVVLFAGVQAMASRHVSPHRAALVGAMIPRHDPNCSGPAQMAASSPESCQTVSSAIERAEASYYGW